MDAQPVILYVEDDAPSRRVMQMLLKFRLRLPTFYIFEDSENFKAKIDALDPLPDVVFLDIHVPPMNGFEMLKVIRENPRYQDVPVIALTASVMNEEVQQLHSSGFNGCVGKPLDQETFPELLQMIQNGDEIWRILS